eukprot:8990824-Lingulodinium_polyedra.AAC.1
MHCPSFVFLARPAGPNRANNSTINRNTDQQYHGTSTGKWQRQQSDGGIFIAIGCFEELRCA